MIELDCVYCFKLDGDGGGNYMLNATSNNPGLTEGEGDAQCTITMDAKTFIAIGEGTLDPMQAFMTGRLKIEGDMKKAINLMKFYNAMKG